MRTLCKAKVVSPKSRTGKRGSQLFQGPSLGVMQSVRTDAPRFAETREDSITPNQPSMAGSLAELWRTRLVDGDAQNGAVASVREAVEVSVSARADEILLRAASRTVRGVP